MTLQDLIECMRAGLPPEMTPERRALAKRAVASMKARENEDIDAWAAKLAADVMNETD